MATTISSVNQSLVDSRVVAALRYVLMLLQSFSFRADDGGLGLVKNDSIYVPIATDPTAQDKTAGTMVTANGTLAGKQVQLSNLWGAGWDANEGEVSPRLFPAYWADKTAGGVYALAKKMIDTALAVVTAANFSDVEGTDKLTVAPADFGQQDLGKLWGYANDKIKQRQRSLILNTAYAAQLMGETQLALIFATAGQSFIQTGILPGLLGMGSACYPDLPDNDEHLGGVVLGQGALLVGCAPVQPLAQAGEGDIVERRIITDPESGVSVLYTMTASGGGSIKGEVAMLGGVAAGQNAAVRLVNG